MKVIARQERATMSKEEIPENLNDPKYLQWTFLKPIIQELDFKVTNHEPYGQNIVRSIQDLILSNEDKFWSSVNGPSSKLVTLYLFKKLGIHITTTYESVIADMRSKNYQFTDSINYKNQISKIYALTHVIITASDFYSKHLNADDFTAEVDHFRDILNYYVNASFSDREADVLAEILICYKILKLPMNNTVSTIESKLIERQNPDGSWGKNNAFSSVQVHYTSVATMALIEFTDDFRTY